MSQTNSGSYNEPERDRSKPRYRPLEVPAAVERPSDWPAPDNANSGEYGSVASDSWGPYPAPAPTPPPFKDNQLYDYSRFNHHHRPRYNNPNMGYYSNRYAQPMPPPTDPQALAVWRVRAKRRFYRHLRVYLIVNVIAWLTAFPGFLLFHGSFWPIYMTLFWGLGLWFEYRRTFGQTDQQRQRMIEDEMRRIK